MITYSLLCYLAGQLVASLEALNASGRINYSLLTGIKRMAFAAQLNTEQLFSGSGSERIATGANHLRIMIIGRMNLFFHMIYSATMLTFRLFFVVGS